MKKFFSFAVIALTAAVFTSCGYKSVETPLNDELTSFTAKTDDGTIVYGVKNKAGQEVVPVRFESVSLYADGILAKDNDGLWLYTTDGHLVYDGPSEDIFEDNGNLIFQTYSEKYRLVPAGSADVKGPYSRIDRHGSRYLFAQDDNGMGCTVYDESGKQLLYGGRITYLFSKADDKYYFIVRNDEKTATAYDETGTELFALNVKKLQKLPKPEWTDISVEKVVTKNKLEVFKAPNRKRH